jgi:uncharacterized membrane protein YbhN (UPF0104 family)
VTRAARYAVGAALLALVCFAVNPVAILQSLAHADLRLVLVGVLGLVAMHAVMAAGWRWMITERSGVRLSLADALRAHYAAQAVGSVTPGNLGADVHRAALLRRAGHGWSAAVDPIVVQRATSYLALSLLAAAALVFLSSSSPASWAIVAIATAVAIGLVGASWLLLVPGGRFGAIRAWLLARFDRTGASASAAAPAPCVTLMAGGVASGLAFHAGSIGLTWLLVQAMDPATPLWPMLAAITVARLSLAIPISPNGLGVQEGALAALVAGLHLAPEPALAAMLVGRLSTLLLAALGVLLLMLGSRPSTTGNHSVATAAQIATGRGKLP